MSRSQPREAFAKVLLFDSGAELLVSRQYIEPILVGQKKTSIREGVLLFSPGCKLFLRSGFGTARVAVTVTSYVSKQMKHLTLRDARSDGFDTREALISQLHHYYPLLDNDSIVTVIKFRLC